MSIATICTNAHMKAIMQSIAESLTIKYPHDYNHCMTNDVKTGGGVRENGERRVSLLCYLRYISKLEGRKTIVTMSASRVTASDCISFKVNIAINHSAGIIVSREFGTDLDGAVDFYETTIANLIMLDVENNEGNH